MNNSNSSGDEPKVTFGASSSTYNQSNTRPVNSGNNRNSSGGGYEGRISPLSSLALILSIVGYTFIIGLIAETKDELFDLLEGLSI